MLVWVVGSTTSRGVRKGGYLSEVVGLSARIAVLGGVSRVYKERFLPSECKGRESEARPEVTRVVK